MKSALSGRCYGIGSNPEGGRYYYVVAETVAAVLCHLYGYEGYIYHGHEYIKHYARDSNPAKAVLRVLSDVEKVLTAILGAAQPVPEAGDDPFGQELPAAS